MRTYARAEDNNLKGAVFPRVSPNGLHLENKTYKLKKSLVHKQLDLFFNFQEKQKNGRKETDFSLTDMIQLRQVLISKISSFLQNKMKTKK